MLILSRRPGSRWIALFLAIALATTGAIVFAAAARAKCEGRRGKAGTNRRDVMKGNKKPNVLIGRRGNDKLVGAKGADRLCGNGGKDRLFGDGGRDRLNGGGGRDVLVGGGGNDLLKGGGGPDRLKGGGRNDKLVGGRGRDKLTGGAGRDRLIGGPGYDVLNGGKGFDTCSQGERYISCERILPTPILDVDLGVSASTFDVAAEDIAPGDEITRTLDLSNGSSLSFAQIVLTTTAAPSTPLTSDVVDGLMLTIERCSSAWSAPPGDPPAYSCTGTTTVVLGERPVIGSEMDLGDLASSAPGGLDHLLVRLRLPETAPDGAQGTGSVITYTFNA